MVTSKQDSSKEEKKATGKPEEQPTSSGSSRAQAEAKPGQEEKQELESLLGSLQGDLTAIDPDAAMGVIDEWYGVLHKSKEPELKELANGLKQLKQHLKSGKASRHEIGEVLIHIGEQTTGIADEAEKGLKSPVQKLGKQLMKAGNTLCKTEDQENIEELHTLTETLQDDLKVVEPAAAIGIIDHWYGLLHKSEDEHHKAVAESLKHLKSLVKASKPKQAAIAEALIQLGEQTTEIGAEAGRGFKGAIQRLGKSLSKVGKSLGEAEG
ncbi:MAG: hypothetical protein SFW36_19975 [Leptolyngbyaceae cyanobacterium bins.59]|nr:hypothetical protein [Leptolyngbyaceae cyanobacterium bins.59]